MQVFDLHVKNLIFFLKHHDIKRQLFYGLLLIKLSLLHFSNLIKAQTVHRHIGAAAFAALKRVHDLVSGHIAHPLGRALVITLADLWLDNIWVAYNDFTLVIHKSYHGSIFLYFVMRLRMLHVHFLIP